MSSTKYRLSLKKSKYPCRPRSKENTDTLNLDFDIYKYREDEVYKTDASQSDTQSVNQFRSDLSSISDRKKFPCYHVNNRNSSTERCDNREQSNVTNKSPSTLLHNERNCVKAERSTPIEIISDNDEEHRLTIEKSDQESNTERNISEAVPFPCSFLASLSPDTTIQNSNSLTTYYRENYKYKKRELCRYLYQIYNERIFENRLPDNMMIQWNIRMRRAGGKCSNTRITTTNGNIIRTSKIVLATKILDTPDRLRDTLLHEMCHAAAWLIDHEWHGHGSSWKKWTRTAAKVFPELPPIKQCHDYKIRTRFTYRCLNCGYSIGRHSKSIDITKKRCGKCYGKFELLKNKTNP